MDIDGVEDELSVGSEVRPAVLEPGLQDMAEGVLQTEVELVEPLKVERGVLDDMEMAEVASDLESVEPLEAERGALDDMEMAEVVSDPELEEAQAAALREVVLDEAEAWSCLYHAM